MKNILNVIFGIFVFIAVYTMFEDDKQNKLEKDIVKVEKTTTKAKTDTFNEWKSVEYQTCYAQMTRAHNARNLDRMTSIKVKEKICKAFALGEDIKYEGRI